MRLNVLERELKLRLHFLGEEAYPTLRLLVEHYTGADAIAAALHPETEVGESAIEEILYAVSELEKGRPVQYVLREAWFYGRLFTVDERVLVPRPETEELVHWLLAEHPDAEKCRVADWCTGSGCIAVTLAAERPSWRCEGIDAFEPVLQVARENAAKASADVSFRLGDLLSDAGLSSDDGGYDILVSNPPYVRLCEKSLMPARVRDYEPAAALFVPDDDPLLFYRALALWGRNALRRNGQLYVEINEFLAPETVGLFRAHGYGEVTLRQDMHGKNRMIRATCL